MKRVLLALLLVLAAAVPNYARADVNEGTLNSGVASDAVRLGVEGRGSVGIQIIGTWTGTVSFQATISNEADVGSATWVSFEVWPSNSSTSITSTTANGAWTAITAGFTHIRAFSSAGTTGDATVRMLSAASPGKNLAPGAGGTVEIDDFLGITATGQATAANSFPVVQASDAAFTVNPTTSGGLTFHDLTSAATTNATNVKASAGQVYHIELASLDATPVYFKMYNTASAPACNSDTVVWKTMIPANATAANGSAVIIDIASGVAFGTGISYCLTTGIADSDTGAVAASEILVNIGYK